MNDKNLKKLVRRYLPATQVNRLTNTYRVFRLIRAYLYDASRYVRYSSTLSKDFSSQNLRAKITATYHNIEKGLSLPSPRPGFGATAIKQLLDLLDLYIPRYGADHIVQTSLGVLDAYLTFNSRLGVDAHSIPHQQRIATALSRHGNTASSVERTFGTIEVDRARVLQATESVSLDFFESRSSVRQFDDKDIDIRDVEFAVRAAQKAPSVCNRQYGKIYVHNREGEIERILKIQGGANGFAAGIKGLAIITTGLSNYWEAGERTQAWTDGGMFAMNFVLGLHTKGIGSVCLNWSKPPEKDKEMHKAANIPEDEAIIMLVGFGHLKERYEVASSPRVPIDETLIVQ